MYKLKERPPINALEFITSMPQTLLAAHPNPHDVLGVGAAVFCNVNQVPYLLLLQRSQSDSLPGRWEMPGGGVDAEDATVRDAVAREVKEETGLTISWVIQEVGHGVTFHSSRRLKVLKVTFVVEIEEIEKLVVETNSKCSGESGMAPNDQHKSTMSSVKDLSHVPVALNDAEHQKFVWLSEEQITSKTTTEGEELVYTSDDQKAVMLAAFEIQKQIIDAKSCV